MLLDDEEVPGVFSFDVKISDHDSLKLGITRKKIHSAQHPWHRIVIVEKNLNEAHLAAAQMALTIYGYVTAVHYRI